MPEFPGDPGSVDTQSPSHQNSNRSLAVPDLLKGASSETRVSRRQHTALARFRYRPGILAVRPLTSIPPLPKRTSGHRCNHWLMIPSSEHEP